MGASAELASFAARSDIANLPSEVVTRTRLLILDHLGCVVRANADAPSAVALKRGARALSLDHGAHHVFGDEGQWSAAGAAFLNASLGHGLDFDDTHAPSTLHPGAPVIPAAMAACVVAGASGATLLAAVIAGYEATCRIGLALPAGDHYARGYHPTATCGVFGAAIAAGRAMELHADEIESAIGIALSQSAGSLQFLVEGAWTKPFQVGWASMAGLSAALFAREGYVGPKGAIEGRHGFLSAYAPNPRPDQVAEDLGVVFETMVTGVKPYPSCRYGHAGIDAILAMRAEHQFLPDEIEQITYGLSRAGLLLVGEPNACKQNPTNIVEAQFSAPFVLSTALATGTMAWDSYANLGDPTVRNLMRKVTCVHDEEIEAEFPANMSGKVTIQARGMTVERTVIVPLGEPANFMSEATLTRKFQGLAEPLLGSAWERLAAAVLTLDRMPRIEELAGYSRAG
jgi:2-methylcitrate dehydratase PrpD